VCTVSKILVNCGARWRIIGMQIAFVEEKYNTEHDL